MKCMSFCIPVIQILRFFAHVFAKIMNMMTESKYIPVDISCVRMSVMNISNEDKYATVIIIITDIRSHSLYILIMQRSSSLTVL